MKQQKLAPSGTYGTLPYRKEILGQDTGWMQVGFKEVIGALSSSLIRTSTDHVILSGCEVTEVSGNTEISAGYVYSRGYDEIIRVKEVTLSGTSLSVYLEVTDDAAPFGTVRFADNIIRQAHIDRTYTPVVGIVSINALLLSAIPRLNAELINKLQSDDWHVIGDVDEPAFENSWQATAGQAQPAFKIDHVANRLILRGSLRLGSFSYSSAAFTLPEGFRPANRIELPAYVRYTVNTAGDSMATCTMYIRNDAGSEGKVSFDHEPGSVNWVSMDGISVPLD